MMILGTYNPQHRDENRRTYGPAVADRDSRAKCTVRHITGVPCPNHMPLAYAKCGAKHVRVMPVHTKRHRDFTVAVDGPSAVRSW